jgi:hypothetical protein
MLSFGNSLKSFGAVREALVLGVILVSVFALFYFNFDWKVKIGITVIALALATLTSIANQLLNIQKETTKAKR